MRGIIFAKIKQFFQDLILEINGKNPKKNLKIDGGGKEKFEGE